jgi:hypothetical protein
LDIVELIPAYDHPAMISLRLAGSMILHVLVSLGKGSQLNGSKPKPFAAFTGRRAARTGARPGSRTNGRRQRQHAVTRRHSDAPKATLSTARDGEQARAAIAAMTFNAAHSRDRDGRRMNGVSWASRSCTHHRNIAGRGSPIRDTSPSTSTARILQSLMTGIDVRRGQSDPGLGRPDVGTKRRLQRDPCAARDRLAAPAICWIPRAAATHNGGMSLTR